MVQQGFQESEAAAEKRQGVPRQVTGGAGESVETVGVVQSGPKCFGHKLSP